MMATKVTRKRIGRPSSRDDARQAVRRTMNAWLASLPKELAEDLKELFSLMSNAANDSERKEIAATITELLYPDTLIVELEKKHRLDSDDQAARNRLTGYRKKVGRTIAKFRQEKGMSQTELGEAVGISARAACADWKQIHAPTHVTIERVAKALGVCPSQIDPGFNSSCDANDDE